MRKAKPIELKILEGNPGKRKIPENTPKAPADMPEPPKHLDKYALEEWERIAEGLNSMGILSSIDQAALAAYCGAYGRWRAAEEELEKLRNEKGSLNALILKTVSGNYIQQPLIGIANKAAGDMVRFAAEFGMTPAARARLGLDASRQSKSKFDGLIGLPRGKK
jgi:P27 family predicted phage terminase small subunit